MSSFSEDELEKKLLVLKDTHESISSLSSWCLEHPEHHKKIVSVWLLVLKKVKIEQRLTLFYLANDVIQYSKRKGYNFVESWGTALQKATTMVRDDKVKNKILRLFKIWDERSIYDEAFLVDLSGLLSSRKSSQTNQEAQEFQPINLIYKIRSCKSLEDDTDTKRKIVNDSHLSLNDADALHSFLKDRRHGADLEQEIDEGVEKMMNYISALRAEIKDRTLLIEILDLSEAFYENQRGEAKVVCNAYKNFSKRVENLKKKLVELTETLPSPIPSPDINAPSPSPESDIELPEDNLPGKLPTGASFIGSLVVPEHERLKAELYTRIQSPDGSPLSTLTYKPPTPPRSLKRKSSPHTPYIANTTPTLSSSSTSNYSANSPYQPVPKPNVYTPVTTAYVSPTRPYSNMYNPEDNNSRNSYTSNVPSPESYQVSNAPPPLPVNTYANPPPPVDVYPPHVDDMSPDYPLYHSDRKFLDYSIPPPTLNEYNIPPRPFYAGDNISLPPLLGEECPPTSINGLDNFLQGELSVNDVPPNASPLDGSGFSSFMGNLNLSVDFQKGLFSDHSCDTPASPDTALDDSTSQLDPYFSDSNHEVEGKPIEVISRTKQPDVLELMNAIKKQGGVSKIISGLQTVNPVLPLNLISPSLPPPPPPPRDLDNTDKNWNQPPMLPPKFPIWSQQSDWADTPASPPIYEKSGNLFIEPMEFEDSDSVVLGDSDTDLRALAPKVDIDHRNLISLTSSPRDDPNASWPQSQDTDYRKLALAPKRATQDVNVESVDMEMSSDEDNEGDALKSSSTVSFSLVSQAKPLTESPLKEKEEPKTKKLLSISISTTSKLPEPPPLPVADEMFTTLENDVKPEQVSRPKLPSPPIPPPILNSPPPIVETRPKGVPVLTSGFSANQRMRGNVNHRPRFPHWQNNHMRPRNMPITGPRYRPDSFRGRPPWFPRPPRYTGWYK